MQSFLGVQNDQEKEAVEPEIEDHVADILYLEANPTLTKVTDSQGNESVE